MEFSPSSILFLKLNFLSRVFRISPVAARLSEKLLQFRESLKGFIYDQISRVFESFSIVKSLEMRAELNEHKSMVVVVDDNVEREAKGKFLLCEMEFKVKVATINFVFIENIFTRDLIWNFFGASNPTSLTMSTPFPHNYVI